MYRRNTSSKANNKVQVISMFIFLIFATVSISGIYMIVSEIGKIAEGQRLMVAGMTGNQTVQISDIQEQQSDGTYVTYKNFIEHQRKTEKDIKSIRYELERLREKVTKRSNPL